MKRIIVSIGVLLLTLNGFGYYFLKNNSLTDIYEWADKSTWNGAQPTNFVSDAFYCSTGSGKSATRTYVNPGYTVDFPGLGLGQWAGQTSIVHVAENAYIGVHNAGFIMCSNAEVGKRSYAELHMTGAMLEVYNLEGATKGRDLKFGASNVGGISILDLQQGSVITNGTSGATTIAGAAEAVASIGVTNSAIYAPSGSITVGSASNSSQVSIDLHNGLFYGGSSAAPSSAMTVNGGDFALSMSGKSEFKVASFESKLSLAGQKQSIEVSDGTLMITNATSGNGKMTFSSVAGSLKLLQSGGLIRSDAFTVTTTGAGDFSMAVSNAAVFKAASMTMYPNAGTSQTIDLSDSSLDLGSGGMEFSGAGNAKFRQTGGTTKIGKLTLKTTNGTGELSMAVSNAAVFKATSVAATANAGTRQTIDFADSLLDLNGGAINLTSSGKLDFRQTGGKVLGGQVTLTANESGELSFAISGETELQMTKFSPTVAADAKVTVEIGGGLFAVTNATSGSGETQRIKLTGGGRILFRQTGGVVTAAGLYFNGTGDNEPRYELAGGTLGLDWTLGCQFAGVRCEKTSTKAGTLSLIGGGALLKTPMFGTYKGDPCQPLFEYVITTNGIPRAQFTKAQDSASSWLQGFFKIRPQGGLQLIHTNVINLVDSKIAGRGISVANLGIGTKLPNGELWDSNLSEGDTQGLKDLPVTLVPAAEFKSDTYVEEGRSSGYAVVPKVKEGWKKITVMLDLLPQNGETLETLKAGFEQAGFKASAAEGDYNVAVEIPGELLSVDSADDKVVFDFKDYPDSDSVRLDTPKVRALVRRCKVVKPAMGLMLLLF